MMAQKIENRQGAKSGKPANTSKSKMPLKYIKNDEGNFVCPDCGAVKRNQSTMFYHMKKHEEELTYTCKECKKGFLQKQTLDLHIRSKHPELLKKSELDASKKFRCPYDDCEFTSLTKGNTVIHCLRVHFQDEINNMMLRDNETKTISCIECQKEFASSCAFFYHCKSCLSLDANDEKHQKLQEIIA